VSYTEYGIEGKNDAKRAIVNTQATKAAFARVVRVVNRQKRSLQKNPEE
jgi:hypothetical protein